MAAGPAACQPTCHFLQGWLRGPKEPVADGGMPQGVIFLSASHLPGYSGPADRMKGDAMTEADWNTCTDPKLMLEFLRHKASDRKLRLFACGCCRLVWHLLSEEGSRKAVETAEQFADATLPEAERRAASLAAVAASASIPRDSTAQAVAAQAAAATLADDLAGDVPWISHDAASGPANLAMANNTNENDPWGEDAWHEAFSKENRRQADLIRDLFGNPFRSVSVDSGWLTPGVIELARTIYDGRNFERLPVLADALEEAGCHDPDILAHCRRLGDHARGCWAVDLLLAKE